MKILLIVTLLTAVLTVDYRDLQDQPGNSDEPTGQDQRGEERTAYGAYGQDSTSAMTRQDVKELKKIFLYLKKSMLNQITTVSNWSKCKSINTCVVMGGFCVVNPTLCEGRLVPPDGCTGINCHCCIPGVIENKIQNLTIKLKSMEDTLFKLESMNSQVDSKLKLLSDNLAAANSQLDSKLNLLSDNLAAANSQLDSKVKERKEILTDPHSELESNIKDARSCTAGFFRIGNQCFKLFTDSQRSWDSAKLKCQAEGLQQAEPNDPLTLRKYIIDNFGDLDYVWLGARGDNTTLKWERNGMRISSTSALWFPNHPGSQVTTSYCLWLLTHSSNMKFQPKHPFYSMTCSYSYSYALCEA